MPNETHSKSEGKGMLSSFEDKIRDFQHELKELANSDNLDDLKSRWNDLSGRTLHEIEEHPIQMVALAGVLGFSLGIVGKRIDFKKVTSRTMDWAAKLGASWAAERIADGKNTKPPNHSVH